jgi:demethylmenaquinone methyltransferase/2-methoxy-6-polyprenyl-1,4-benzoquinol methylase
LAARTFVAEVQAPLNAIQRTALQATLDMFWGKAQDEVGAEDWARFQRLCRPGSEAYILDAPDYYAFVTYTALAGSVPVP